MFGTAGVLISDNKFGVEQMGIVVHFMPILVSNNRPDKQYDKFKSYLVSQIKRGITKEEELKLAEGIYNYIRTEPGSDERSEAMKYLFELKFLV